MSSKMLGTEELYRTYQTPLRKFFLSRAGQDDAEELLQELFVKVHIYLSGHPEIENPKSWLFQCARNLLTDYYRKNARRELPLDQEPTQSPEQGVVQEKRELAACLEPLIKQLPGQYGDALRDSSLERRPHKEIAARQGSSLSAVKSRVMRAKQMLGQSLEDCCFIERNRRGEFVTFLPREKSSPSCCQ
jgi:RNA polymerase sigma-70 factor (ECF subfamily)